MQSADPEVWNAFFSNPLRADLVAFMTTILPLSLYFAITESSASRGSWGKRKRGLRVATIDGQRLSFGNALARNLLKFVPWQIAHTCLFNIPGWPIQPGSPPSWVMAGLILVWVLIGANIVSLLINPENRTLYDIVSGTRVGLLRPVKRP